MTVERVNSLLQMKRQSKRIRTYAFETLFSISTDFFCIVYSILINIRYAYADYRHSNA